jgi:hypothetical protein
LLNYGATITGIVGVVQVIIMTGNIEDMMHTHITVWKKLWSSLIEGTGPARLMSEETLQIANVRVAVYPFTKRQGNFNLLATKIPKKSSDKFSSLFPILIALRGSKLKLSNNSTRLVA